MYPLRSTLNWLEMIKSMTCLVPLTFLFVSILLTNHSYAIEMPKAAIETPCSKVVTGKLSKDGERLFGLLSFRLQSARSEDEIKYITDPILTTDRVNNPFSEDGSSHEAQLAGAAKMFLSNVTQDDWDLIKRKLRNKKNNVSKQIEEITDIDDFTSVTVGFDSMYRHFLKDIKSAGENHPFIISSPTGDIYLTAYGRDMSINQGNSDVFIYHIFQYNFKTNRLDLVLELNNESIIGNASPSSELGYLLYPDSTTFADNQLLGILSGDRDYLVQIDLNTKQINILEEITRKHNLISDSATFFHASDSLAYFYWPYVNQQSELVGSYFQINKKTGEVIELFRDPMRHIHIGPPLQDDDGNIHWIYHKHNKEFSISTLDVKSKTFSSEILRKIDSSRRLGSAHKLKSDDSSWISVEYDLDSKELSLIQFNAISQQALELGSIPFSISDESFRKFEDTHIFQGKDGNIFAGVLYKDSNSIFMATIFKMDIKNQSLSKVAEYELGLDLMRISMFEDDSGRVFLLSLSTLGEYKMFDINDGNNREYFVQKTPPINGKSSPFVTPVKATPLPNRNLLITGINDKSEINTLFVRTGKNKK